MNSKMKKTFALNAYPPKTTSSCGFDDAVHDAVHDPFEHDCSTFNLAATVKAAIARAHKASEVSEQEVKAAKAKTEAAQRTAHGRRFGNIRRWAVARAKLLSVVLDIDKTIEPQGMALSMVDFGAHPFDVAAVQVRMAIFGRPSDAILEIVVGQDMTQRLRIIDAQSHVLLVKLPNIPRVKKIHYCRAVISYLESALPQRIGREEVVCHKCGLFISPGGTDLLPLHQILVP